MFYIHGDFLFCFVSGKIDLHFAPILNKASTGVPKPGLVWFIQPPGNAPSLAENSTGYLAGAVVPLCWPLEQLLGGVAWASWHFCGDVQDRDALGWESVLQPLV